MTIVLCSKGYQEDIKNIIIKKLNSLKENKDFVYHAGTKL